MSMRENLTPFDVERNIVWGFDRCASSCVNAEMKIADIRRNNLSALCKKMTGGNVTRFGELIGKSQSATSDLLLGRKSFGEKMARSIEENLDLVSGYLDNINVFFDEKTGELVTEGTPNTEEGPSVRGKVPLISWVQAGMFCTTIDLEQPGVAEDWVKTTVPVKAHTYALKVVGDSMEPTFPEGIIIIVEPEMEANSGDFVIARNENHEATFKQLIKDGSEWFLKPLNPRYPIRLLTSTDEICGVIRSAEHRFR